MIKSRGYIESDNIVVFPSTRRIGKAQESKHLSEKALTRIINTLIDTEGFVITPDDELSSDNPFEFNIHGFYFRVEKFSEIEEAFGEDTDVFAHIKIEDNSEELLGFDDDNNHQINSDFSGVKFTNSRTETGSSFTLHVLSRDSASSSWKVSTEGTDKFNNKSFKVDGGIIS